MSIHSSWLDLTPRKNEEIESYSQRIGQAYKNIPEEVLQQWFFLHAQNLEMINNYGWIDYHKAIFTEVYWTEAEISRIQIFSKYKPYVESRSNTENFSGFRCTPKDKEYWANLGTWRVPIVVLKTDTIKIKPDYSELNRPYQLVEGHTRLGYFQAFSKYHDNGLKVAQSHKIYLMEISE